MLRLWPTAVAVLVGAALVAAGLAWRARRAPLQRAWRAAVAQTEYALQGNTRVDADGRDTAWAIVGHGSPTGALRFIAAEAGAEFAPAAAMAAPSGGTVYTVNWPLVEARDAPTRLDALTTLLDPARDPSAAGESDASGRPNDLGEARTLPPRALGPILPAGDPLLFLATGHAARLGDVELVTGPEGDRACRRVDFLIGARAYATFWHERPGRVPVNANAGGLWKFEGEGTAWIDPATDLPCRIRARLRLPRLVEDRPGVGEVDWFYSDWRP